MRQNVKWLALILIIVLIAGCGGGSAPTPTPSAQPIPTPNPLGLSVIPIDNALPLSLTSLTGRNVYAIYSVMNDAEGEKPYVSGVDVGITLNPALIAQSALIKEISRNTIAKRRKISHNDLHNPTQMKQDHKMRESERLALKSRPPRYTINRSLFRKDRLAINDTAHFWVDRGAIEGYIDVTATCLLIKTNCYIFVDNAAKRTVLTDSFINQVADFFNDTVYPTDRATFGNDTDTDADQPIYILFSQLETTATSRMVGYFDSNDKFARTPTNLHSNQHDMFYLTIPTYASDLAVFKNVLAHEFQHMINFDRHYFNGSISEQVWLNEALSELAGYICTGDVELRRDDITEYLSGPTSLTVWDYDSLMSYSSSLLFGLYLYDRFYLAGGNTNLILNLVNSTSIGIQNVTTQTGVSFNSIFRDWCAALYISGNGWTTNSRWQYQSLNLHINGSNGLAVYYDWAVGSGYTGLGRLPYTPYIRSISGILATSSITITGSGGTAGGVIIAP